MWTATAKMGVMRWDGLFADLEAHAEALEDAERRAEVESRTRGEVGQLRMRDRLRAAVDTPLRLRLSGGTLVDGVLRRVGPDWLLLDEGAGREAVVASAAVITIRGLGRLSAVPASEGVVESRLGLRNVLRGIARDRSTVRIHLTTGGAQFDTVDATIDRVGADFVEVATHAAGAARRRTEVREVELVPLAALVAIRRSI
jgi:hypothetical protein